MKQPFIILLLFCVFISKATQDFSDPKIFQQAVIQTFGQEFLHEFQQRLAATDETTYTATQTHNNKLIGLINYSVTPQSQGYINCIAIDPQLNKQGVVRSTLLQGAINSLRGHVSTVNVFCNGTPKEHKVLSNLGFRLKSPQQNWYQYRFEQ